MGMDVYGVKPSNNKGEYFRRNIWGWRPLWDYVQNCHPEIAQFVEYGHSNDGDGLNALRSGMLAQAIRENLANGKAQEYLDQRNKEISELPMDTCNICDGSGIRTDEIGVQGGMTTKELDPEVSVVVGRSVGWCNACHGYGEKPHFATNYYLDLEDFEQFAEFLENCGGFEIW